VASHPLGVPRLPCLAARGGPGHQAAAGRFSRPPRAVIARPLLHAFRRWPRPAGTDPAREGVPPPPLPRSAAQGDRGRGRGSPASDAAGPPAPMICPLSPGWLRDRACSSPLPAPGPHLWKGRATGKPRTRRLQRTLTRWYAWWLRAGNHLGSGGPRYSARSSVLTLVRAGPCPLAQRAGPPSSPRPGSHPARVPQRPGRAPHPAGRRGVLQVACRRRARTARCHRNTLRHSFAPTCRRATTAGSVQEAAWHASVTTTQV